MGRVAPAPPVPLFAVSHHGCQRREPDEYLVARDGKRFLMNTLVEQSAPITLILNAAAEEPVNLTQIATSHIVI